MHADSKENFETTIGDHKIIVTSAESLSFVYSRYEKNEVKAEAMIVSNGSDVTLGIFPNPPLLTPKSIAKNVYLKFKTPLVVEQRQNVEVYAKMPIEIAVYRQSRDEEVLIDAFSLHNQRYALYGSPESGVVCRYKETEISVTPPNISKFEEAQVKIHVKNDIDNVVKISKVIIPMENVILDHTDDNVRVSGKVEMNLDSTFGKDIVNVQMVGVKVKRLDKTSAVTRQENLTFLMDAGY